MQIKKFARSLVAAGLVIVMTVGTAFASYGTGTVTADALRMRSQPNTTSSIVTVLYEGTKVELLSAEENGWYKVSYNGNVGYMSAEWLNVVVTASTGSTGTQNPPAQSSSDTPAPAKESNVGVVVGAGLLNVRSGPDTSSSRIGFLKDGDVVTIADKVGDWYKISILGTYGYVSAKYISVGDQEYVLKSKKKQLDIQVVPGVHNVRISSTSKKQAKLMKGIGMATQFVGAVTGSGSTYVVGSVLDDVGGALSKEGVNVQFEPGEFMELKIKMNFMGQIVEDDKA